MESLFKQLGFNPKEAQVYQALLADAYLTAADVAKRIKESRTNTYMILNRLVEESMVIADDFQSIRRYRAVAPKEALYQKVGEKRRQLQHLQQGLSEVADSLQSQYNLSQLKPGVIYLEGVEGLRIMLEDIERCQTEVLLIPDHDSWVETESWGILQEKVLRRCKKGIRTRAIFHDALREQLEVERIPKENYEIRFLGTQEYPGEVAVYGEKCAFTTYQPAVITTIITNDAIAQTMIHIFEELWEKAEV